MIGLISIVAIENIIFNQSIELDSKYYEIEGFELVASGETSYNNK